jgi:hypothetical protein
MSPRRNWDSPNSSLVSECAVPLPPEPGGGGGGAHSSACEGLGESQFRRLQKKLSTLPTLCLIEFYCLYWYGAKSLRVFLKTNNFPEKNRENNKPFD